MNFDPVTVLQTLLHSAPIWTLTWGLLHWYLRKSQKLEEKRQEDFEEREQEKHERMTRLEKDIQEIKFSLAMSRIPEMMADIEDLKKKVFRYGVNGSPNRREP